MVIYFRFNPERFLSPSGKLIKHEHFVPFGVGKRFLYIELFQGGRGHWTVNHTVTQSLGTYIVHTFRFTNNFNYEKW